MFAEFNQVSSHGFRVYFNFLMSWFTTLPSKLGNLCFRLPWCCVFLEAHKFAIKIPSIRKSWQSGENFFYHLLRIFAKTEINFRKIKAMLNSPFTIPQSKPKREAEAR